MNELPSCQISRSRALIIVAASIGSGLVAASHMGKIPGALPVLQESFFLNLSQSSLVVSSFSILSAVFGVTLGMLAHRLGAHRAGSAGLLATTTGAVVGTLATDFPLLLASRILEGFGFLLVVVTMPGLINRVCPPALKPIMLGIWGAFIPTAMCLMLLASPVVLSHSGWRGLWWLSSLLSLLLAITFFLLTRKTQRESKKVIRTGSMRKQFRGPLQVSGIFSCYSALFAAVTAYLPTYWTLERGLDLGHASHLASLVVVGNIAGNILAGFLVGRGMTLKKLMLVALVGGGFCAALTFSGFLNLTGELIAAWMFTFCAGMLPGAVFANIGQISPSSDTAPLTTGMIFQGAGIGQVLGPIGFTIMASAGVDWSGGAIFLSLVGLLGFLLIRLRS